LLYRLSYRTSLNNSRSNSNACPSFIRGSKNKELSDIKRKSCE
jgi:hypothetical protein